MIVSECPHNRKAISTYPHSSVDHEQISMQTNDKNSSRRCMTLVLAVSVALVWQKRQRLSAHPGVWAIKKAERGRIDAFELWCWELLRVRWTVNLKGIQS